MILLSLLPDAEAAYVSLGVTLVDVHLNWLYRFPYSYSSWRSTCYSNQLTCIATSGIIFELPKLYSEITCVIYTTVVQKCCFLSLQHSFVRNKVYLLTHLSAVSSIVQ